MLFADGLIFAFCAVSGWVCGQRGRCPSQVGRVFWGLLRIFIQRCIGEMGDCLGELRHRVDLLI